MLNRIDELFGFFVKQLGTILFYKIGGFPIVVIVLLLGGLTFTIYFKFINIRGFPSSHLCPFSYYRSW